MYKLEDLKGVLVNSGTLDKSQKQFIRDLYEEYNGRKLHAEKSCKSCWLDAVNELILKMNGKTVSMSLGKSFEVLGVIYTNENITESAAMAIIKKNPNDSKFFKFNTK